MKISSAALCLRSFLLQAGFSDERRQALGFAWAIDPALRFVWAEDGEGLMRARTRQLTPFNTNPYACGFVLGASAAMERGVVAEPSLAARAAALKGALSASLAGAADAFFWGALRPLAVSAAVLAALGSLAAGLAHPLATGSACGLFIFNVPALSARFFGLRQGLAEGEAAALAAARIPVQAWLRTVRLSALAATVAVVVLMLAQRRLGAPRALAAASFAVGAAWTFLGRA